MHKKLIDYAGDGEHILFVDDEMMIAELYRELFTTLGYKITIVTSGEEALKLFIEDAEAFDCIITDYKMSRMNGAQLITHIRSIPTTRCTPIILCSGYCEVLDSMRHMALERVWFLEKPHMFTELFGLIKLALGK